MKSSLGEACASFCSIIDEEAADRKGLTGGLHMGLGERQDWVSALPPCTHDPLYLGVIGLYFRGEAAGGVDIWRCTICKKLFCEEKRYGVLEPAPEVGFPELDDQARWAVLVCHATGEWSLMGVREGERLVHTCKPGQVHEFRVGPDYCLEETGAPPPEGQHSLYLVERYVNNSLVIA